MLIHTVYFWLKQDLSEEDESNFLKGLRSLALIKSADAVYIGAPSATDRPVIDRSYSYGLTVVLKDMERHDAYQDDPIHDAFRKNCAQYWDKIVIYDFE